MADNSRQEQATDERALCASLYARFPRMTEDFGKTLFQLNSIARTYSQSRSYDITFHALRAIAHLTGHYLTARSGSLIMPTSLSLFMEGLPQSDRVLSEQLETLAALHKSAIEAKDIELSRQILDAFLYLALHGMTVKTYVEIAGENTVTDYVLGYLQAAAQQGATEKLDDVALNGCRALATIGKAATSRNLYLTSRFVMAALQKISSAGTVQNKPFLVHEAVKAISEMASVAIYAKLAGTNTIDYALEILSQIAIQEASIPRGGLGGTLDIQMALGPFLNPGEETSIARLQNFAINELMTKDKETDATVIAQVASTVEELNRHLWRLFADIGSTAAPTEAFGLHFVNESISVIANQMLSLWSALREHEIAGMDSWQMNSFREKLLHELTWIVTAVHWRIYDKLPSPAQTTTVWEFFTILSQIGIRCVDIGLEEQAIGIIRQLLSISKKSIEKQPEHGYGPPRIAEHIARIGIIAQKDKQAAIFDAAIRALKEFQQSYLEWVKNAEGLRDRLFFEIRELTRRHAEGRFMLDPNEASFFRKLSHGDAERFLETLKAEMNRQ